MEEFKRELTILINRFGIDAKVDLPDFILAEKLCRIIEGLDWNKEVFYPEGSPRSQPVSNEGITSLEVEGSSMDEIKLEPVMDEIKLEPVYGSTYCQYSVIENKLETLYKNQEKLLQAIKLNGA